MDGIEVLHAPPRIPPAVLEERIRRYLDGTAVREAWLFGSYAAGTADAWSDVDLVLVEATDAPFVERGMAHLPLLDLGVPVDLIVYTPEEFDRMRREGASFLAEMIERGRRIH
ncbi:MAG: nucleotidyltransferase domain-containing protein [Deltaproteobacteria bacterium]|nr:nucleotidyltransferase domain-containing protein [Deltaproteobacteria bacterium]